MFVISINLRSQVSCLFGDKPSAKRNGNRMHTNFVLQSDVWTSKMVNLRPVSWRPDNSPDDFWIKCSDYLAAFALVLLILTLLLSGLLLLALLLFWPSMNDFFEFLSWKSLSFIFRLRFIFRLSPGSARRVPSPSLIHFKFSAIYFWYAERHSALLQKFWNQGSSGWTSSTELLLPKCFSSRSEWILLVASDYLLNPDYLSSGSVSDSGLILLFNCVSFFSNCNLHGLSSSLRALSISLSPSLHLSLSLSGISPAHYRHYFLNVCVFLAHYFLFIANLYLNSDIFNVDVCGNLALCSYTRSALEQFY